MNIRNQDWVQPIMSIQNATNKTERKMKTFIVTRTTVLTLEVQANDKAEAEFEAFMPRSEQRKYVNQEIDTAVIEKLAAPEYRVVVEVDEGYDPRDCDDSIADEQEEAYEQYGAYGFIVESRTTVDGKWEHVDSCWGFLGNDLAYMLSQAADAIPEGVTARVYGGPHELDNIIEGTEGAA